MLLADRPLLSQARAEPAAKFLTIRGVQARHRRKPRWLLWPLLRRRRCRAPTRSVAVHGPAHEMEVYDVGTGELSCTTEVLGNSTGEFDSSPLRIGGKRDMLKTIAYDVFVESIHVQKVAKPPRTGDQPLKSAKNLLHGPPTHAVPWTLCSKT